MNKLMYKPVSLAFGMAAGAIASMAARRIWKLVSDEDEPPSATSRDYGWGEVLAAAALQGAIFAVVKAAIDRGGAEGVRKLTGEWPGD